MQEKIKIELKNYRCFQKDLPLSISIEPGKTIALLGKNNVGKSALLRFFYELKHPIVNFPSGSWNEVEGTDIVISTPIDPSIHMNGSRYGIDDLIELFPKRNTNNPLEFSISSQNVTCQFEISRINESQSYQLRKKIIGNDQHTKKPEASVEIIKQFSNSLYFGSHRNIVNQSAGGNSYYDLSIGSAFIEEWNRLKNGSNIEASTQAIQAEKLIASLLSWDSLSINSSTDNSKLYLTINNENRFSISELGAGISELILCIVTASVKKPSWILIDEPESHLHPDLQVKFVEALTQLASHGVIFTTHSIGLARTCADSIYVIQQDNQQRSYLREYESNCNYSQLLGELSFSQFHELGFDTLLLCEGVTEIKTLRQLLRIWNLDSFVMIIPLGGDALIDDRREDELNEFKRMNVNVFVLVDSEQQSENEPNFRRTKFIEKCKSLFGKNNAIQTKFRATENYFHQESINEAMRSNKYKALEPFQNSKTAVPFWGKNQNWKIASKITKAEWQKTDIGKLLDYIVTSRKTQ